MTDTDNNGQPEYPSTPPAPTSNGSGEGEIIRFETLEGIGPQSVERSYRGESECRPKWITKSKDS